MAGSRMGKFNCRRSWFTKTPAFDAIAGTAVVRGDRNAGQAEGNEPPLAYCSRRLVGHSKHPCVALEGCIFVVANNSLQRRDFGALRNRLDLHPV